MVGGYSGVASYIYSARINCGFDLEQVFERLMTSEVFAFALNSDNRLLYKCGENLCADQLKMQQGKEYLEISGHEKFISCTLSKMTRGIFASALLQVSSRIRLYGLNLDFPERNVKLYLKPLYVKMDFSAEYISLLPVVTIYSSGVACISFTQDNEFDGLTAKEVVCQVADLKCEVESAMCDRSLFLAVSDFNMARFPFFSRFSKRKVYSQFLESMREDNRAFEFFGEKVDFVELCHSGNVVLGVLADSILSVVVKAISVGRIPEGINWFSKQYNRQVIPKSNFHKTVVCIRHHADQKRGAAENYKSQRRFVTSVMSGFFYPEGVLCPDTNYIDVRMLDDFNHFYGESSTLVLSSSSVGVDANIEGGFSFEQLCLDSQELNVVAQYALTYYASILQELNVCKTSIRVAELEFEVIAFEESFSALDKSGEILNFLSVVKSGKGVGSSASLVSKKIEVIRKGLELDEKISYESDSKVMTVVFGLVASATLSPELMQPAAELLGLNGYNINVLKISCIFASVIIVFSVVRLMQFVLKRKFRRR